MVLPNARKQPAKASDGKLPSDAQKQFLCETMLYRAFLHIRVLGWQGDAKRAAAVADAFHNLPFFLHRPDFLWSSLLLSLNCFYDEYPEDRDQYPNYLEMFDEVLGMP